jgi:hypothetical protein
MLEAIGVDGSLVMRIAVIWHQEGRPLILAPGDCPPWIRQRWLWLPAKQGTINTCEYNLRDCEQGKGI